MVRRIVGVFLGLVLAGIGTFLLVRVGTLWSYLAAQPCYLAAVFCGAAPFFEDADGPGGGDGGVGIGL
ncbi:hypothetical protein ACFC26_06980 [Kitasatospora purpeofusca]|uniref:hypothetical protein n=1 Tax=Kitasatospora TaxID=2063 RepID=UPI0005BBE224|nr:hypothetical protein [Kitasatospora sp. MBT66]